MVYSDSLGEDRQQSIDTAGTEGLVLTNRQMQSEVTRVGLNDLPDIKEYKRSNIDNLGDSRKESSKLPSATSNLVAVYEELERLYGEDVAGDEELPVQRDYVKHLPESSVFYPKMKNWEDTSYDRKRFEQFAKDKTNFELRDDLFQRNVGLVFFVAKRFKNIVGVDRQDMIQEAMVALLNAVNNFNPDLGFQFSTYAVDCIYWSMSDFAKTRTHLIHIPENRLEKAAKKKKILADSEMTASEKFSLLQGVDRFERVPFVHDGREWVADEDAIASQIRHQDNLNNFDTNTEQLIGVTDPELDEAKSFAISHLRDGLNRLDLREKYVITRYFGLDDNFGMDMREPVLQELASELGVSRERVAQIISDGLRKIRRRLVRLALEEYPRLGKLSQLKQFEYAMGRFFGEQRRDD